MTNDSLMTSFWVMVVLRTVDQIDIPGPRKMPAPGAFVSIIAAWVGLDLFADAGFETGASVTGWVIVLASLVIGPMGNIIMGNPQQNQPSLLQKIAMMYRTTPVGPSYPPSPAPYQQPIPSVSP